MDLKKEIKLSDLVRRPERAKKPGTRSFPGAGSKQSKPRKRKSELVGLKIGATQLAASRVANNGSPHVLQLAREDLPSPGSSWPARFVRCRRSRARSTSSSPKHGLPRRGVRLGVATNRIGVRAFEIAGVEDDRQLANAVRFRAHEAVVDPARRGCPRLSRRRARRSTRPARSTAASSSLPPTSESIDHYTAACKEAGSSWSGSTSRRSRFCALWPRAQVLTRRRPRSSPSRSATTGRRSPSPTAPSATSRASSSGAARRSPARSSASSSVTASEASELKLGLSLEDTDSTMTTGAPRALDRRCGASFRRSPASLSPRFSSTRASRARSRSATSCSRAGRAGCRACPRSSSA